MRFNLIATLLIAAAGFAVYANSLPGEFVWDDVPLIEENTYLRSWKNLPAVLTKDLGSGAVRSKGDINAFYRPLQTVSYMVDYGFWKLNPVGYHLGNIIIHIAAGLMVFLLIKTLFGDALLALLTALFFVLHPIQTEAVAYISGRTDPLAAFWLFTTFFLYVRSRTTPLLSYLAYAAALLSKEISVMLPLLLLMYEYAFRRPPDRSSLKKILPFAVMALVFISLKLTAFNFAADRLRSQNIGLFFRLSGFSRSITEYSRLLLMPSRQHMEYGVGQFSFLEPAVVFGYCLTAALIIVAIMIRKKSPLVFFSISWFLINLLPFSGLYPMNTYMAEHWLYIPSLGFFLLVSWIFLLWLRNSPSRRPLILLALGGLLAFYGLKTILHNQYWKDPPTFYNQTCRYVSDKYKPEMLYNLGDYYSKKGLPDEALRAYQNALRIDPGYYRAYNNIANLYARKLNYETALQYYSEALRLNPQYLLAYTNMGYTYYVMGRYAEAIQTLQKALQIAPGDKKTLELLAEIKKTGRVVSGY